MSIQTENISITTESKYLMSIIAKNNYAFELSHINEIILTPSITRIPNQPVHKKGIINLRKNIIPLYDLRTLLGYKTSEEEVFEFINMLKQREQDHVSWLDELHASITENREFRKTTDPHACAFGKWYDNYKTDNIRLGLFLRLFDEPHKRIHKSAIEIQKILSDHGQDAALDYYRHVKDTDLSKMIKLFHELYVKFEDTVKSYSIIFNYNNTLRGFIVDEVERISVIPGDIYQINTMDLEKDYIKGIVRDLEKDYLVLDHHLLVA